MVKRYPSDFCLISRESSFPSNIGRAYQLSDGDVFSIYNLTVQFSEKEKLFYEVIKVEEEYECGVAIVTVTEWKRTGRAYTQEELSQAVKVFKTMRVGWADGKNY